MDNKIQFLDEEGNAVDFYVVEQTKINGMNYLLVTDSGEEEEEGQAYIMKDLSGEDSGEAVYEMVEQEDELSYVGKIFAELLDGEEELI